jgi:inositol phosphorylceramide synthase catalytic subunit
VPPTLPEGRALPSNPWSRLRALWGRKLVLPCLPALYALALVVFHGDLRPEHLVVAALALALGGIGVRTASLYRELLPIVVTGIGYDCVRYARALWVTPDRVLSCGFKAAEQKLVPLGGGMTLPEWFMDHHVPAVDVAAAVPYFAFVYVAVGYAVWLRFRDVQKMSLFAWAFAFANWISFTVWIALPVAPPWYVHAHGCDVSLAAVPSPAGLARVDALLGFAYFSHFYARAASVFGALPSMHCAYPMLGLFSAWRGAGKKERAIHVTYALWMAASAVYLGHHWVIDVLAGWATAFAGVRLARLVVEPRSALSPAVPDARSHV